MFNRASALMLVVTGALLACQTTNIMSAILSSATPTPTARPRATPTPTELVAQVLTGPVGPVAEPPTPVPPVTATIKQDSLRVRAAPNTTAAVVDQLNKGDSVQVVARTAANDWLKIFQMQKPDKSGWISAQYAQVTGGLDTVPVVQPGQSSVPTARPAQPAQPVQPYPAPQPFLPPSPRPYP